MYCFNTASCTWSKVGDRDLPFWGKVQHDRDLDFWVDIFGCSRSWKDGKGIILCASSGDLYPAMDSHITWKFWWSTGAAPVKASNLHITTCTASDYREPQMISLGSGKFCIVQFFLFKGSCCHPTTMTMIPSMAGFDVYTSVEVTRRSISDKLAVKTDGELRIVFHRRYMLPFFDPGMGFVL